MNIRHFVIVLALAGMAAAALAQAPDPFAVNQRLGRGVNIIGWDPLWQDRAKGRFQDEHFKLIREAGFDHVRINLHPLRDGKPDANGKLREEFFKTLDWAIDQSLANRLMVVLDYHDDLAISPDPVGKKKDFLASWAAIAEHCKGRPAEVLFEVLNEPAPKFTAEMWNEFCAEALQIIRQSNPNRTVIIGPAMWNGIGGLEKLAIPEGEKNVIVTVHYYTPMEFTHQGAPWANYREKTGVPWNGTAAEVAAVERDFDKAAGWATKNARPLYLGEFGAYDKADMASRVRYISCVARETEKRKWSWAHWQFDGDFITYDIRNKRWSEPIRDALVPRGKE